MVYLEILRQSSEGSPGVRMELHVGSCRDIEHSLNSPVASMNCRSIAMRYSGGTGCVGLIHLHNKTSTELRQEVPRRMLSVVEQKAGRRLTYLTNIALLSTVPVTSPGGACTIRSWHD